jgi:DNA-binding response OmpR family regulator
MIDNTLLKIYVTMTKGYFPMTESKPRILIVDDDRYNLNILVHMLKSTYRIIVAKNGKEALRKAISPHPPDLILLDIMMPGMDGYEVCQRLKAHPKTHAIPVIFITAMSEVGDEIKGFEVGAIDYLTKPVSPSIVKARVKNHLELKQARKVLEEQKQTLEEQNKALIEAARLREDVECITTHDLKTPLNTILGFSQVIMEEKHLPEKALAYLKRVEESGYKMLDMLNRSLNLLKMEQGTYQVQLTSVDLVQVVDKIAVETKKLIQSKNLTLDLFVNGHPPGAKGMFCVHGENLLCYSMLANLIKNALEASPEGERVLVTFETTDQATIRIHNQGAVPEHIQDKFFEKYVTSGKKRGTGLGTYSAKLMAETQHGGIAMTTSERDGTTVTIRLPKAANTSLPESSAPSADKPGADRRIHPVVS